MLTSSSDNSSMTTMPLEPWASVSGNQACGTRARGKERRRRYSTVMLKAMQAMMVIRAAPPTEATMGHQGNMAAAPPPAVGVLGEGGETGTACRMNMRGHVVITGCSYMCKP